MRGANVQEIRVVTDIRLSSDSTELVVVRQTLRAEDDRMSLVGEPAEGRIPLANRRVTISFDASADNTIGFVVVARLRNVSLVPFEVTRVCFEYKYPEPAKVSVGGAEATEPGGALDFVVQDRNQLKAINPGATQEWYLPMDFLSGAAELVRSLPPGNMQVVAYSGSEPVGLGAAQDFVALLNLSPPAAAQPDHLRMNVQMRHTIDALPPPARAAVRNALKPVTETPQTSWEHLPGVTKLGRSLFAVSAPPDYRVFITPYPRGGVEILDLIRLNGSTPGAAPAEGGAPG
jgi:hypothetical protein